LSDPRDPLDPTGRPGGGSGEERPPPLIPSRAARHQPKRGRMLRGRPATPPSEPPVRRVPDLPAEDPFEAPPPKPARRVPTPTLRRGTGGRGPQEPGERPSPEARQLRVPRLGAARGSSLGLAGTLVAVAVVLVVAADALPVAKPPSTPATGDPYSARWVCPLLPGQATPVTIANVGGSTATLRTVIREQDKRSAPTVKDLAGGVTQRLSLKPKKPGYVQVEAFSAPVVVSAPGLGCAPGPSIRWWLPASDTRLGTDTKVIIANPDSQPAVVDLVPHLTSGSIRPEREIFVKPGEAQVHGLGDDAPPGLKPSIEVVARAGRVVVGATVSNGAGRQTLLPAQGAARPAWSFAGGVSGGGRQAQVLVTNPNPAPLQVNLQVATAKGTFKPAGEFDEPIANGGTVELAIPALDVEGPFAVQVRSVNGAPFVAALRVSEGDGTKATSRIDLGTGQPERGWLVPGLPEDGRLVLANLSSTELEARLGDLTAGGSSAGKPVRVPAGRVAVQKVPAGIDNLLVEAGSAGLVAAPLNGGPIVPGSAIGGLPAGGPIVPGPAAAP
jgi:hypothetical protein